MRTMTAEHKAKLKAGRESATKWEVTVISLGNDWTIKHVDPYNYELYKKDVPSGYFTNIRDAMISAIRKSVGTGLSGNLESLAKRIDDVERWVKSASFGCVQ